MTYRKLPLPQAGSSTRVEQSLRRAFGVAVAGQRDSGGQHGFPFGAQGFDDGWQNQPFDVSARRVMRAEFMTFDGIERAFEQRAENRRFDFAPVAAGGGNQQFQLLFADGKGGAVGK